MDYGKARATIVLVSYSGQNQRAIKFLKRDRTEYI